MAEWQVTRRADGAWRIAGPDDRPRVAHAVTDADGTVWVHVEGEVTVLPGQSTTRVRPQAHGHASLEAPMPAQVTAVLVAPGDEVDAGTTLVLLDAMKMELPLRAPTAGRIEAVHCIVGQRVVPGRALVDLVASEDTP